MIKEIKSTHSKSKGFYYNFIDLVDKNSENYDKIVVIIADNDVDALNELALRQKKAYGTVGKPTSGMYQILSKKEII